MARRRIKAPAFQFYPRDYLCDGNVRMMTFEQRGIYVELLALCWLEGDLPGDVGDLAKMTGLQRWRFDKAWLAIRPCFVEVNGRLRHKRLDAERAAQEAFTDERSNSGKRGAAARWGWQSDGSAIPEPMAPDASSSASASASASASTERKKNGHPLDERTVLEPWSLEAFGRFMAVYPRPEARKRALDAWRELSPTPELATLIVADLNKRIAAGWAEELQFVPFPAKYLDERRWQERYAPKASAPKERSLDGLPCMRSCPDCGQVQEGRYESGQKVFPACAVCARVAKVGA